MTNTAQKIPRKHIGKIAEQWSEPDDGYWILLAPHWHIDNSHAIHETSMTRAIRRLPDVKPCNCGDCGV